MTFEVLLPLPPREVSPNGRHHWAVKARATKLARREAWYWFRNAMPKHWFPVPITLDVVYRCPRQARGYKPKDVQNAIGALKASIDGMVDAGVVPDDSAEWVSWGSCRIERAGQSGVSITVKRNGPVSQPVA